MTFDWMEVMSMKKPRRNGMDEAKKKALCVRRRDRANMGDAEKSGVLVTRRG
ncbi:hypothetical protein BSFA1_88140 (plasmid) [Burkholderia sp. SFA1]|nr:hypothetical protein BSFA1_88140 [Burkholderia sp. SFA1]